MGNNSRGQYNSNASFGTSVDYFLFSLKSKDSIYRVADQLADHCNCHFSMLPIMKVEESAQCKMSPEFQLLHAQYANNNFEEGCVIDPVDRLNIILFQNKALRFNKAKSILAKTDRNGVFSFIDDGCECHAFSHQGVRIGKCTRENFAEFYLMVFAKKMKGADKLSQHIAQFPGAVLTDLTQDLYNMEAKPKSIAYFFRSVLAFSENQIRQMMRKSESYYIGTVPQSLKPPYTLFELPFNTVISKSEININNF